MKYENVKSLSATARDRFHRQAQILSVHADANSSYYDPPQAIRVGRMLEDIEAVYFEEPCPFDHLEDTKVVTDALTMPVAGGEQEFSDWRFHPIIDARHELGFGHPGWSLQDRLAHRQWRHGRGLQGARHGAQSRRRDQNPPRGICSGCRPAGPLHPSSSGRTAAQCRTGRTRGSSPR